MRKNLLIFANHNNGCNILEYLTKRKDVDIVKVVVYEEFKNQWWRSVKKLASEKNLDYIIYKDDQSLYQKLKNLDIDLILSINWRHKISLKVLKIAKMGGVNFHNSLLPKHRGAYANVWPIILGEKKTGVTLHWMTENFDDGDIIYQEEFKIYAWETARDVWEKINRYYLKMFKKLWPKVDRWRRMSRPQRGKPSYHSVKDFETTNRIGLKKKEKIGDFINFLRGKTFDPYYKNAFFFIDPETKKKVYVSINLNLNDNKQRENS